MPTVGVVVEGSYDEAALSEFVQVCLPSNAQIISRQCGNAIQLMRKFPAFLNEFEHVKEGRPVDKALVIRDADHKTPSSLIAQMEEKIRNRRTASPRSYSSLWKNSRLGFWLMKKRYPSLLANRNAEYIIPKQYLILKQS